MNFNHRHYVPCLRWKQGEYQALQTLTRESTEIITPLIEVAEMGYDFETGTPRKTLDKHVEPFAKRVAEKWGRPCFVDLNHLSPANRMANGRHPVQFIFDDLRARGCPAVPVTGLSRDEAYQRAVGQVVSRDKRGFCLRLDIGEAAKSNLKDRMDALLADIAQANQCDLVLDLGAPNFTPLEGFSKAVEAFIRRLPYLRNWRAFALLGTSFPQSMAEIKSSPVSLPRNEWLLYQKVASSLAKAGIRVPAFGDYGINYPNALPMDMRLLKPSATIRYTTPAAWFIVKGPNVRDNQFEQYRTHCRTVMRAPDYSGSAFSAGDKYIADCARGAASTGNLTTWRRVGTSHHLELVARSVASFFASASTASPAGGVPPD
jgi:hypothetical protein